MPSTPIATISNSSVQIKLAILPANSFTKPATNQFKTLTAANDASIKFNDQDVDVSTFGSGVAVQMEKVSAEFSADLSGIVQSTDPAFQDVLIKLGGNGADALKKAYVEITCGDGSKFEGPVLVSGLQLSLKLRDVYRWQCNLKGCGEITYTAPVVTP